FVVLVRIADIADAVPLLVRLVGIGRHPPVVVAEAPLFPFTTLFRSQRGAVAPIRRPVVVIVRIAGIPNPVPVRVELVRVGRELAVVVAVGRRPPGALVVADRPVRVPVRDPVVVIVRVAAVPTPVPVVVVLVRVGRRL